MAGPPGEPGHALPPERRRVGLMFQDFALFPHLRVAENVAFGLLASTGAAGARGGPGRAGWRVGYREPTPAIRTALSAASSSAWRWPGRLPRARADAAWTRPSRPSTPRCARRCARETLAVLRDAGTPTLLVTHDAEEAIRVGDRIHAMQQGWIVQSGTLASSMPPGQPVRRGLLRAGEPVHGRVVRAAGSHPWVRHAASGLADGRGRGDRPARGVQGASSAGGGAAGAGPGPADLGPVHVLAWAARRQQGQGAPGRRGRGRGRRRGGDRSGPAPPFVYPGQTGAPGARSRCLGWYLRQPRRWTLGTAAGRLAV